MTLYGHWEKEVFKTDVQGAACEPRAGAGAPESESPISSEASCPEPTGAGLTDPEAEERIGKDASDVSVLNLSAEDMSILRAVIDKLR